MNYGKYVTSGEIEVSRGDDYTAHSTRQLNVAEVKETLLKLSYIREAMAGRLGEEL